MEKTRESSVCPYCLSPVEDKEEYVICPVCGVAHHAECWHVNGKCSVYGCDGWQAWSTDIAEKIAPKLTGGVNLDDTNLEVTHRTHEGPVCIDCGKPVKRGHVTCVRCRVKSIRFFESCFGTSVVILGAIVTVITLLMKGLS